MQIQNKVFVVIRNVIRLLPLLFILAMLILHLILPVKTYSKEERRYFAQIPIFKVQKVFNGSYGARVEEYFSDQFPFREFWIKTNRRLKKTSSAKIAQKSCIDLDYINRIEENTQDKGISISRTFTP